MEKGGREKNDILLSIIIPTKNRQHTCLYAIESALMLNKTDVEIIVQDCSDTDILKQQIVAKFGPDNPVRYEYVETNPSMTDNWNRAFERATGLYKCGIGDDDAVLPNIYELTLLAKDNGIDALGHNKQYEYFWPDFTGVAGLASRLVKVKPLKFPDLKIYSKEDLHHLVRQQAAKPGMDYRKLPMAYHCLISSRVINNLVQKTGRFLDGTSLDVYSAFSLGVSVNRYYVSGVPFTLPGACGLSNSNLSLQKKLSAHYSQYKNIVTDKRIPPVQTMTFTIAESTQKAFVNCGANQYSDLLDLPYLYAQFMAECFTIGMFRKIIKLMRENYFSFTQYLRFILLLLKKGIISMKHFAARTAKKMFGLKSRKLQKFEAGDILTAAGMIPIHVVVLPAEKIHDSSQN